MKFTLEPPVVEEQPTSILLVQEEDGDVRLDVVRGTCKSKVLRITKDGRVALIICQKHNLEVLGFQVGPQGTIKLIN